MPRAAILIGLCCVVLLPAAGYAGTFEIRHVYYDHQDGTDHVRIMVGAVASYVGSSVDSNDNSWAIESSLTYLGTTYKNFANSGQGIPYVGYEIECAAGSCGAYRDIPYCNVHGNGSSYRGDGVVAIYHQFTPETHNGTAGWATTTCNSPPPNSPSPNGGEENAPGDGTCNAGCPGTTTPILVDLDRAGLRLTSFDGGVRFDLNRDGVAEQLSWISRGSGDGWLVLDRNGNGEIDDGGELFGNFTEQPASADPNGYEALAVFDENGDGWLTEVDAVFPELAVWVDVDHDGRSSPGELRSLSDAGVSALEISPVESRRRDVHGNLFRYTARVRLHQGTSRSADAYLLSSQP